MDTPGSDAVGSYLPGQTGQEAGRSLEVTQSILVVLVLTWFAAALTEPPLVEREGQEARSSESVGVAGLHRLLLHRRHGVREQHRRPRPAVASRDAQVPDEFNHRHECTGAHRSAQPQQISSAVLRSIHFQ